jgi:CHAT domain-containing protein
MVMIAESRAPNMPRLQCVEDEILCVDHIAHDYAQDVEPLLFNGSTTCFGIENALQKAQLVHLACHGIQDSKQAMQSGFCLGDGRLTIARLMDLQLDKAFFAFLSACETARGDDAQPDQVIHLGAAMLFTGFQSVVATLW